MSEAEITKDMRNIIGTLFDGLLKVGHEVNETLEKAKHQLGDLQDKLRVLQSESQNPIP